MSNILRTRLAEARKSFQDAMHEVADAKRSPGYSDAVPSYRAAATAEAALATQEYARRVASLLWATREIAGDRGLSPEIETALRAAQVEHISDCLRNDKSQADRWADHCGRVMLIVDRVLCGDDAARDAAWAPRVAEVTRELTVDEQVAELERRRDAGEFTNLPRAEAPETPEPETPAPTPDASTEARAGYLKRLTNAWKGS